MHIFFFHFNQNKKLQLTWHNNHIPKSILKKADVVTESLQDSKRFTVKSVLKFTPNREHHNSTFSCELGHPAVPTMGRTSLRLEVSYYFTWLKNIRLNISIQIKFNSLYHKCL